MSKTSNLEHSMSRRDFLAKTGQAAGGAFACSLLAEGLVADGVVNNRKEDPVKAGETANAVDENYWIGGY